jgi:hypothetical protein
MLKYEENERPSFVELAKLVLTSEDNTLQSQKQAEFHLREEAKANFPSSSLPRNHHVSGDAASSPNMSHQLIEDTNSFHPELDSSSNFMTQADLFRNYVEVNELFITLESEMFWFEFGGQRIGRLELKSGPEIEEPMSWKLLGKYKSEFACHFTLVFSEEKYGLFILGGSGNNCLNFKDKNITAKANMPEKSFFSAVYLNGIVYTFGGYDTYEKVQLRS